MSSLILRTASRFLLILLVVFSVLILLRGHNEPGGGFVGGLLSAAAFALYAMAHGPQATRQLLRVEPRTLIAAGLLTALGSGTLALLRGQPFLTGQWFSGKVPGVGHVGTVLLFDLGVYLVVMGTTLLIVLTLSEE
ncbi:MAG: Na(+)/H(+) antiporter subunit B [Phycisphaerae bacterium]